MTSRLKLFVSLRYLTFSRTKLGFRFDLDKLKANFVRFKIIEASRLLVEAVRVLVEAMRVIVEG